ncbi:EamA family transporter [Paenibacillus doosanensis]|uniref:4-amino-4-deoxy-L-arabinose-phosphoundecaprenol flippase subunit ArnF n=1 Tax=Paenibacillus konkukensis TaxID=2020716 RepID=A0ABY4RUY4_9BACL|nr:MULTISPECIES: EamA family transporter [Paenibacillus]MCS7463267.1 EamA family transporter [Paenibacillus doosanensis]UQZ85199.1 putative 4-amino-4-deoxy-L-arabinose-phosphoundecaprenol flippase subunit ArnF [Paenibacillus konkukensis]
MKYIWLIASILLGALGQVLMKWGIESLKSAGNAAAAGFSWTGIGPIIAGLASYGISSLFWLLALRRFPLSTAYPMVSLSYILVMIMGYVLFQETLSMQKWFGAAFITAGVLIIARA